MRVVERDCVDCVSPRAVTDCGKDAPLAQRNSPRPITITDRVATISTIPPGAGKGEGGESAGL